ncbi:DUF5305 domain-containing protein [Haloarcula nitratireducens]|uniref:DUF5305 domain-containing protein n=1 Tax=Haloarcula nitratireducens TaxID=2487749 RepID=A0AAW4PGN2_9EURY|nr:DUF5305 domain-containing protein [Halomicroarcula nitratireducens]MBX0297242.1 DUF5305 domain-containing protein [Halomicroarcula nitratireducens]
MSDRLLRMRAVLDKQFIVAVIVLALLVSLGGWVTYTTHVDPGTTTEERPVSSWQTNGWFNHSATVTETNSVYPVGTTLTNRSVYFTQLSPGLNGTYTFTYGASNSGELNGTVSLQLVFQGVEENGGETTVIWQTTRQLQTVSRDSLEPGETVQVPFSVNMTETSNRTAIIDEQLGNPPGQSEVVLKASVDMQGTVNGQSVTQVKEHTLPVTVAGGTYRVAQPSQMTDRREATQTVTVDNTYGPLRTLGAPVLLLVALCAFGGLVTARFQERIALSTRERERLTYADDRDDFEEWISTIKLPDEAFDLPEAEATSLSALVDFAIDTDNSVIEDPDDDAYYVIHDSYRYTYRPPTGGNSALDTGANNGGETQSGDTLANSGPSETDTNGENRPSSDEASTED